ncbi:MAG: winged helix-turn-helix transcriptional regulator [Enterobacter hormaechei]
MAEMLETCCEKKSEAYTCPMTQFVNLISGKWAIPILYRLIVFNTPVRFGVCCVLLPHHQKELTKQLRLFEQRGLVTRTVARDPPRVEYQITELGLTFRTTSPLAAWMSEYGDQLNVRLLFYVARCQNAGARC